MQADAPPHIHMCQRTVAGRSNTSIIQSTIGSDAHQTVGGRKRWVGPKDNHRQPQLRTTRATPPALFDAVTPNKAAFANFAKDTMASWIPSLHMLHRPLVVNLLTVGRMEAILYAVGRRLVDYYFVLF